MYLLFGYKYNAEYGSDVCLGVYGVDDVEHLVGFASHKLANNGVFKGWFSNWGFIIIDTDNPTGLPEFINDPDIPMTDCPGLPSDLEFIEVDENRHLSAIGKLIEVEAERLIKEKDKEIIRRSIEKEKQEQIALEKAKEEGLLDKMLLDLVGEDKIKVVKDLIKSLAKPVEDK